MWCHEWVYIQISSPRHLRPEVSMLMPPSFQTGSQPLRYRLCNKVSCCEGLQGFDKTWQLLGDLYHSNPVFITSHKVWPILGSQIYRLIITATRCQPVEAMFIIYEFKVLWDSLQMSHWGNTRTCTVYINLFCKTLSTDLARTPVSILHSLGHGFSSVSGQRPVFPASLLLIYCSS